MSMHPQAIGPIPEETARVARAACPRGNPYLIMRDQLGTLYDDQDFAALFSKRGRPAEAPWQLALVCVFQFMEGLSDRQAAEAVRSRTDWKYALGLELADPGFDYSVLSKFRARLLVGTAEMQFLDTLLERFKAQGLLKPRGKQRTDSTHVLAAIRTLNRLESVGETLRAALNAVATVAPEWLRELPAVQILRRTWICQYYAHEGRLRWRKAEDLPPAALRADSPYDPEAHYGNKRSHPWTGYKVHVTETCDDDEVHLITHVETTLAGVTDSDLSAPIQEALAQKTLLPGEHFLDAGYVDADLLVTSRKELGIEVVGPVRASFQLASPSWAGLRCGALSGGLASPAGRLPTRLHQYVLDPSYRCLGQPGE